VSDDVFAIEHLRAAMEAMKHPMKARVVHLVHPDELKHLQSHGGEMVGDWKCERCLKIWAHAQRVHSNERL